MTVTRYDLTVYVETVSPLHSGGTDEEVDRSRDDRTSAPRAFARDGHGHPVLTGRSVKGAVHAAWKRYTRTAEQQHKASGEDGRDTGLPVSSELRGLDRLWGSTVRSKRLRAPEETSRAAALTFHAVCLEEVAARFRNGEDVRTDGPRGSGGKDGKSTATHGPVAGLPTRTGIAVDRYWGTAGDTALFQHEYVPAGQRLELRITAQAGRMPLDSHHCDLPRLWEPSENPGVTEEQVEDLLADILGLLQEEQVALGGRKGAGWGRVRLARRSATDTAGTQQHSPWHLTRSRLGSREDLRCWLAGGENITGCIAKAVEKSAKAVAATSRRVRVEITWDSPTGILIAEPPREKSSPQDSQDGRPAEPREDGSSTGTAGSTGNKERRKRKNREEGAGSTEDRENVSEPTLPLRSGPGEDDPLVLPGSSVRGALRSRASRIARTVLAAHGKVREKDWQEEYVHNQLAKDPPLVRDLFGSTEHCGALTVLDTDACKNGTSRTVTHNAGDRWTGGAAGGALYSEKVYDNVQWKDIVLELDLEALDRHREPEGTQPPGDQAGPGGQPDPGSQVGASEALRVSRQRAAWCLLGLTLAELAAGTLPLGSRSTRGMGQVRVIRIRVSGHSGAEKILGDLPWDLTAPDDDVPGASSLARQVLARLRDVNKEIRPQAAGQDLSGWSSYLVEPEEGEERR